MLERELPRELENSVIKGAIDLTEVGVVDVERIRHRKISVVEDIESLEA